MAADFKDAEKIKPNEKRPAVPDYVLSVLKGLSHSLMSLNGVVLVMLFGSYAKGTYTHESDIDIAVFVSSGKAGELSALYRKAMRFLSEYPLDIQLLFFTDDTLSDPVGIVSEVTEFGIDISRLQ